MWGANIALINALPPQARVVNLHYILEKKGGCEVSYKVTKLDTELLMDNGTDRLAMQVWQICKRNEPYLGS